MYGPAEVEELLKVTFEVLNAKIYPCQYPLLPEETGFLASFQTVLYEAIRLASETYSIIPINSIRKIKSNYPESEECKECRWVPLIVKSSENKVILHLVDPQGNVLPKNKDILVCSETEWTNVLEYTQQQICNKIKIILNTIKNASFKLELIVNNIKQINEDFDSGPIMIQNCINLYYSQEIASYDMDFLRNTQFSILLESSPLRLNDSQLESLKMLSNSQMNSIFNNNSDIDFVNSQVINNDNNNINNNLDKIEQEEINGNHKNDNIINNMENDKTKGKETDIDIDSFTFVVLNNDFNTQLDLMSIIKKYSFVEEIWEKSNLRQLLNEISIHFLDFEENLNFLRINCEEFNKLIEDKMHKSDYQQLSFYLQCKIEEYIEKSFKRIYKQKGDQSFILFGIKECDPYTKSMIEKRYRQISLFIHPDRIKSSFASLLFDRIIKTKEYLIEKLNEISGNDLEEKFKFYFQRGNEAAQFAFDIHFAIEKNDQKMRVLTSENLNCLSDYDLIELRFLNANFAIENYHEALINLCDLKISSIDILKKKLEVMKLIGECYFNIHFLLEAQFYFVGAIFLLFQFEIDENDQNFMPFFLQFYNEINFFLNQIKNSQQEKEKKNQSEKERREGNEEGKGEGGREIDNENDFLQGYSNAINLKELINPLPKTIPEINEQKIIINENIRNLTLQIITPNNNTNRKKTKENFIKIISQNQRRKKRIISAAGKAVFCVGFASLSTTSIGLTLSSTGVGIVIGGLFLNISLIGMIASGDLLERNRVGNLEISKEYQKIINRAINAFVASKYQNFLDILQEEIGGNNNKNNTKRDKRKEKEKERILSFPIEKSFVETKEIIEKLFNFGFRVDLIVCLLFFIAEALSHPEIKLTRGKREKDSSFINSRDLISESMKIYQEIFSNDKITKWAKSFDRTQLNNAKQKKERKNLMRMMIRSRFKSLPEEYLVEIEELSYEIRIDCLKNFARLNFSLLMMISDKPNFPSKKRAQELISHVISFINSFDVLFQHNPLAYSMITRISFIENLFRSLFDDFDFDIFGNIPSQNHSQIWDVDLNENQFLLLQNNININRNNNNNNNLDLRNSLYHMGIFHWKNALKMEREMKNNSLMRIVYTWEKAIGCFNEILTLFPRDQNVRLALISTFYQSRDFFRAKEELKKYEKELQKNLEYFLILGLIERRLGNYEISNLNLQKIYPNANSLLLNFPFLKLEIKLANKYLRPEYRIRSKPRDLLSSFDQSTTIFDYSSRKEDIDHFILSIDGGGARGIIPSYWLCELEKRTHQPISTIFHSLCGSSTGGLIAGLLSTPNQKHNQKSYFNRAVDVFELFCSKELFSKGKTIPGVFRHSLNYFAKNSYENLPKFDPASLRNLLLKYCGDIKMSEVLNELTIPCFDLNHPFEPFLFTRRNSIENPDENYLLADVLMSSLASPTFYSPYQLNNNTYLDGSVVVINPAQLSFENCQFQNENIHVISMGCGDYLTGGNSVYQQVKEVLYWPSFGNTIQMNEYSVHNSMVKNISDRYSRWQTYLPQVIPFDAGSDHQITCLIESAAIALEEWQLADDNRWNKLIEKLLN